VWARTLEKEVEEKQKVKGRSKRRNIKNEE
jgi:hypothetical protein